MRRTLRCCCGALSVAVEGDPTFSALCHCVNCKQRTGSAFGWSIYFAPEQVATPEGPASIYSFESANGHVERTFCARCGSTLLWRADAIPGLTGLAGGCFGDPSFAPPTLSASDDKRCAWVELPPEWPRLS